MPIPNGLNKTDKAGPRFGLKRAELAQLGVDQALIDQYLPASQNQTMTNEEFGQALIEIYKRLPKA